MLLKMLASIYILLFCIYFTSAPRFNSDLEHDRLTIMEAKSCSRTAHHILYGVTWSTGLDKLLALFC